MQSDEIIYEIIGNHWKSLETIGKQSQTRMCYLICAQPDEPRDEAACCGCGGCRNLPARPPLCGVDGTTVRRQG